MSIPTHGYWCKTRTWPTRCSKCGHSIFFFSCNCGSCVFFDDLGAPWRVHDCEETWAKGLQRTSDSTGSITVTLSPDITVTRPGEHDIRVASEIIEKACAIKKKNWEHPINKITPKDSNDHEIIGILREIHRNVNPRKKFDTLDTTMGRAMLGKLDRKVGKVTVHSPHESKDYLESYTAWVPSELISDSRIKQGITVSILLASIDVPHGKREWICTRLEI